VNPAPVSLIALKGSASSPSIYGAGSPDHVAIVAAIDDAIALVSNAVPLSWDGPDHPSRSWDLEMSDWVEVGVFEHASILQFSVDVVAPMETGLSRSVLGVRDERLSEGWMTSRTPEDARDVVLSLLREWRTICAEGVVVDSDKGRVHDLPEHMRLAGETVVSRFGTLAKAHGMAETLDAGGIELMWHMRSPTAHTRATLCASASGVEEATFDERTMEAVLEGLPHATWAVRDATSPIAITIAPYAWSVGSLDATDPVSVLRQLAGMGIGWEPQIILKDERA